MSMLRRAWIVVACGALLGGVAPAAADESFLGQIYLPKRGCQGRSGAGIVALEQLWFPLAPQRDRTDWVLGENGWVRKSDLIELDRAAEYYDALLATNSNDAFALAYRGLTALLLDDMAGAMDWLNQSLRLRPANPQALYDRALVWRRLGQPEQAQADLDRLLNQFPQHGLALVARASLANARGDVERAIADCTAALRAHPRYAAAAIERGMAHARRGDRDRALADFDQAVQFNPRDVRPLVERARLSAGQGDIEGALDDLSKAIELEPQNAGLFLERARVFVVVNREQQALLDLEACLKLRPDNQQALQMCAELYRNARDTTLHNNRRAQDLEQRLQETAPPAEQATSAAL